MDEVGDSLSTTSVAERLSGWQAEDSFFGPSYIDLVEWRDSPVRYRYVHGGFEGTDTQFSLYLPPSAIYHGRMLHFLQGQTGGDEATTIGPSRLVSSLDLAFDLGAFLVESNQGHIGTDLSGLKGDSAVGVWRASAATANFAKVASQRVFGSPPHHSYIYGGSGGGMRSIKCVEETEGIWDGAAPFVAPHQSQGTFFSLQANATRLLGSEGITMVEDAMEVGGSAQPFAGLNTDQARVLAELYKAGWPRRSSLRGAQEVALDWPWFAWAIESEDPGYFDDFWSKTGYFGCDNPAAFENDKIRFETSVSRPVTAGELAQWPDSLDDSVDEWGMGSTIRAWAQRFPSERPIAAQLAHMGPKPGKLFGATIRIQNGRARGRALYAMGTYGNVVLVGAMGGLLFEDVAPGDKLGIDNDRFLAYCHYYRHAVEPQFQEFDSLTCDGIPLHPQRPRLDRGFVAPYTFRPRCSKMIISQNLLDRGTWPVGAVNYREHLSPAVSPDDLRIYLTDNAQHYPGSLIARGSNSVPAANTRQIDYEGCIEVAVRALVRWVEDGKRPPEQTRFSLSADGDIRLPSSALERCGIQPVAALRANGTQSRVTVRRGEPVDFELEVDLPPQGGVIVSVDWDFDGRGAFPAVSDVSEAKSGTLRIRHIYNDAGTYFPSARVIAQADGNPASTLYRPANLARMRIEVN